MKKKLIITILCFIVFAVIMYLCKDWLYSVVPDHDYSDRVVKNKMIVISAITVLGFGFILLSKKNE